MQRIWLTALMAGAVIEVALPAASAQQAAIQGAAGNLPADFYIQAGCQKPDHMALPKPDYDDRPGVATYNKAVGRYNEQLRSFDDCINAYVDKAQIDIAWIQFSLNAAIAKANGSAAPSPPDAPGNMPTGFYPPPDCIRPAGQLGAAPDSRDIKAMDAYNREVGTFNVLAADFNECIKAYAGRARTDIVQIEKSQRQAALQVGEH